MGSSPRPANASSLTRSITPLESIRGIPELQPKRATDERLVFQANRQSRVGTIMGDMIYWFLSMRK